MTTVTQILWGEVEAKETFYQLTVPGYSGEGALLCPPHTRKALISFREGAEGVVIKAEGPALQWSPQYLAYRQTVEVQAFPGQRLLCFAISSIGKVRVLVVVEFE